MNKKLWIFSSFLLSIFVLAACGSANLDLVEEQTLNLNVGDTYTLTVEEEASLTYETEDSSVATVNSSGIVTAVSEGVTTIIASDGEETDAILVNVFLSFEENPVVDLEYSSSDEIIIVYEDGTRVNTGLVASNQDGADGSDGADGEDGVNIESALVSGGALFVTLSDGTVVEAGDVEGPRGATGSRGPAGPAGPTGPTGATGAQGVSVDSVDLENQDGVDYLVFGFSDGSEEEINFSEFLAGSVEFQNLEISRLYEIIRDSEILSKQIITNSIFGFDPFRWEDNSDYFDESHPNIYDLYRAVNSSTLYDRGANFSQYDRFNVDTKILTINLVLAHYYELNYEYSSQVIPAAMIDLLEIYYDDDIYGEYSYVDYYDLSLLLQLLQGVEYVGEGTRGLEFIKNVNNALDEMNQTLFYQYIMTNPLTGWDLDSINDLRAFISMLAREDLFSVDVTVDYDPENLGIKTFGTENEAQNGATTKGSYFSTDWKSGGEWGFHSNTDLYNYNDLNIESQDYLLSFDTDSNGEQLDLYFGTTNIHPGTYEFNEVSNTYTFTVNYGQAFPLPTEVNYLGMVIGAPNEQLGGLDGTDTKYQISTTKVDEGVLGLDYIVYGDNVSEDSTTARTFRFVTYWFDSGVNSNSIPDATPSGFTYESDDPFGIFHANQDYFKLHVDYDGVKPTTNSSIVTESWINMADLALSRSSFDEGNTKVHGSTTQVAFYSYSWPVNREYITYNQLYADDLYSSANPQNININAYWQEVFQVEWLVSGTSVRYEIVDKNADALGIINTSQAVIDAAIPAGYELVPGNEWSVTSANITANTVINANLREIVYNIFYVNLEPGSSGSATAPKVVTYSASSLPNIPGPTNIPTGYSFNNWNSTPTALSGGSIILPGTIGNLTVSASWAQISYDVTFNANDGNATGTMNNQAIYFDDSENLNSNAFDLTGYSFDGWNTAANGSGTDYADGASFTMTSTGITLYAQWSANDYDVVFDANNGSGTMPNQSITFDTSEALDNNAFTRLGYSFTGWNTQSDGNGTPYADQASFTMSVTGSTLYAQWTADQQVIFFDANLGTGSGSQSGSGVTTDANVSLTALSALGITRAGFTFQGWATTSNGEPNIADEASYTVGTSNVTLYAIWSPITYNVATSINAGGNAYTLQVTGDLKVGETIIITITGANGDNITLSGISINSGNITPISVVENDSGDADVFTITFTMPADDVVFAAVISTEE